MTGQTVDIVTKLRDIEAVRKDGNYHAWPTMVAAADEIEFLREQLQEIRNVIRENEGHVNIDEIDVIAKFGLEKE